MTTHEQLAAVLEELRALARAAHVIAAQTDDLDETYTWQCVLTALHDRRVILLERAQTLLHETLGAESECFSREPRSPSPAPALTEDRPRGRVH